MADNSSNLKQDSNDPGRRQSSRQSADRSPSRLSRSANFSRDHGGFLEANSVPVQDEEDRVPFCIDVSSMTEEDLEDIKTVDPFLYYSIPSVRNASLRGESVSVSSISSSIEAEQASRNVPGGHHVQLRRQSAPAVLAIAAADASAGGANREIQVLRRSRISFELSVDAIMDEIMESMNGLNVDDGDDDGESLDDFLDRISNSRGSAH